MRPIRPSGNSLPVPTGTSVVTEGQRMQRARIELVPLQFDRYVLLAHEHRLAYGARRSGQLRHTRTR